MDRYYRCYAEISLDAIRENILRVKNRTMPGVKLLAVVKANAYGHGSVPVSEKISDLVDYYATATLEEAIELREGGIKHPILILGYTSPHQYVELLRYKITPTIYDLNAAEQLNLAAGTQGTCAKMHIAIDTGMTRIGFQVEEDEADVIAQIAALPHLEVEGMFSHLSCADMKDKTFTGYQLDQFEKMIRMLEQRKIDIPIKHIFNSAAIMELSGRQYDMVRSGIVTYGMYPSEEVNKGSLLLRPALSWRCHVIHVKDVPAGRGVSYGATFVTDKPVTRIATVSVGYADGYPRSLSSKGRVLIHGQYAPILGRVCMDQMMVDVSDIPDVFVEDVVTLIGEDGDNRITIEEVADPAGRFNYEMACTITGRVTRLYV